MKPFTEKLIEAKAAPAPIGVFDSGYGGLTILREIVGKLPDYDYIYLGDNARSPYGTRSFETVYQYTLQAVDWFFAQGCPLVILACNTASAKALRTIQQKDLPSRPPGNRVLGVIRPTTEVMGNFTTTRRVGILATSGTVASDSYKIEIRKFFPDISVVQEACPMWVPLVENNEHDKPGADYFIQQHIDRLLKKDPEIDAVLLACTHYPLLINKIRKYFPNTIQVLMQGEIVAKSLKEYLDRHQEMASRLSKTGQLQFFTTDDTGDFERNASLFFGRSLSAGRIVL